MEIEWVLGFVKNIEERRHHGSGRVGFLYLEILILISYINYRIVDYFTKEIDFLLESS